MPDDVVGALITSQDPPMVVVTAANGDEVSGCLVGFHSQSSIEPTRYCVWLSKANHTYGVALWTTHLAVHALTVEDRSIAAHFGSLTGDEVDKFAGHDYEPGPGGVPLLTACPNRLVVRRTTLLDDGGDHVCVSGEIVDAVSAGPFRPLRLSAVEDLDPGHQADERPPPPRGTPFWQR